MRWHHTARLTPVKRSNKKSSVVGQWPPGKPMQLGPTPFKTGGLYEPGVSFLDAFKHHIPHAVAEFDAPVFELGERAVMGFGRVASQFGVAA